MAATMAPHHSAAALGLPNAIAHPHMMAAHHALLPGMAGPMPAALGGMPYMGGMGGIPIAGLPAMGQHVMMGPQILIPRPIPRPNI